MTHEDFEMFNNLCNEFGLSCSYSETDVSFFSNKRISANALNLISNSLWNYKFEYINIKHGQIELMFCKNEL